ncbi:MAG TPA: SEC-C metal-binding domain-containing protein, partial [Steroidobacteraceae bacterium]|nr:SEC-C metal-binding domain-containing protein [Steroidobacteraceae bacterium]
PQDGQVPPMQAGEFEPINGNHDELAQLISRLGSSSDVLPTNGAAVLDPAGDTQTMPREGDPASWGRVSRNAPCPCGSGKKYKHCHGALASSS